MSRTHFMITAIVDFWDTAVQTITRSRVMGNLEWDRFMGLIRSLFLTKLDGIV